MDYRTLGRSGCAVSNLALGTMTFGAETGELDVASDLRPTGHPCGELGLEERSRYLAGGR